MGTIQVGSTLDKVAGALLNDRAKVRFIAADLLAFYNEALKIVAAVNPSAYSDIVPFTCTAGSRQTVPAGYHSLLGVAYNLGSDGVTPGRAIELVNRESLDIPTPDWRTLPPKAQVRHVVASDELPSIFDVYPPVVAGTKIAIKVGKIPADAATLTDTIPFEDTYEPVMANLVLSRAYQKNAEFADNAEIAQRYYAAAMQLLGVKAQVDTSSQVEGKTK